MRPLEFQQFAWAGIPRQLEPFGYIFISQFRASLVRVRPALYQLRRVSLHFLPLLARRFSTISAMPLYFGRLGTVGVVSPLRR